MIYAENTDNSGKILDALSRSGVYDRAVEIGRDYLDLSKKADINKLSEIRRQVVKRPEIDNAVYKFDEQVRKYIEKNPELIKRYAQFCYAVAGCDCGKLFDNMTNSRNIKTVKEALSEMCGSGMTEAVLYAVEVVRAFDYYNTYSVINQMTDMNKQTPEICFSAAVNALPVNTKAAFLLCIFALNSIDEKNHTAEMCVNMIKDIVNDISNDMGMKQTALAECAYFDDESRYLFRKAMEIYPELLIMSLHQIHIDCRRIFKIVTDENIMLNVAYVQKVMDFSLTGYRKNEFREHLEYLAVNHSSLYITALRNQWDAVVAMEMLDVLQKANPEYAGNDLKLKEISKKRLIKDVYNRSDKSQEIYDYITGCKSFGELQDNITKIRFSTYGYTSRCTSYYEAYGMDDTVKRCIIVAVLYCDYYASGFIRNSLGFDSEKNNREFAEIFFSENVPVNMILEQEIKPENLVPYAEKIADTDISGISVEGRCRYLETLGLADADKYKTQIFAMAEDKSKAVKNLLSEIISKISDCTDELENMLSSKKSAVRSTALEIIEKMPDKDMKDILTKALEKEKSEKLKDKISVLLGIPSSSSGSKEVSEENLVNEITKGSKAKKVEWLYQTEYFPVHFRDGSETPEKYMKAVLLCYADSEFLTAEKLTEKLDVKDLEKFADEVMGRWIDKGAEAKNKWVLNFAAIHGGSEIIRTFVYYIKLWSENMRGAMAAAAVKALALNGSSEALMQIDNMSRKFKSNQVKKAAGEALFEAAEFLGITTEELADRIVPSMNFDEKMCRIFDYGSRKFSVYLTPSLEIEIFNGDKKIKNLPKPNAGDIAETAEKSYAEFKEMKKQLKTVIAVQKARLEYSLMCERKWTAENWEKLFVKNPVMYCFAVGLVWGVYENNKLVSSFRYLDDGSFTTSDEDEFEMPENAEISLVHPVELSDDELSAWTEQLSDYEIIQPFPQLSRTVYRPENSELNNIEVKRFDNTDVVNQTLVSRMQKNGWTKGMAGDGGWFYEFYHTDISRRIRTPDGKTIPDGYIAELTFSGTGIAVYQYEAEDVTIENLCFCSASHKNKKIPVKDVSIRYFSEIIMQLTEILG